LSCRGAQTGVASDTAGNDQGFHIVNFLRSVDSMTNQFVDHGELETGEEIARRGRR
jgi:hypothetical protein